MHGESFQREPCISCQCLDGVYHCSRERCPILGCANQHTPVGRCCPKCRIIIQSKCMTLDPKDKRLLRQPGRDWWLIVLKQVFWPLNLFSAPPPLRTLPVQPRPQRVCTDYAGEVYLQGGVWFPDDCTRCVCAEDGPLCSASACHSDCENPRKVKGVCCGVCDGKLLLKSHIGELSWRTEFKEMYSGHFIQITMMDQIKD